MLWNTIIDNFDKIIKKANDTYSEKPNNSLDKYKCSWCWIIVEDTLIWFPPMEHNIDCGEELLKNCGKFIKINKLLKTYRVWNSWWTFYIQSYDKEDNDYYCEHIWYEDNWIFEEEYILQNSRKANWKEILKFKLKLKNDDNY